MPVRMQMALHTPAQRILNLFFRGHLEASTGDFVSLPDAYCLFSLHFVPYMLQTTELAEARRELCNERAFDDEFSQLFILERIRFDDTYTGRPVLHYTGIRALPLKPRQKRPQLLIDSEYERAEQAELKSSNSSNDAQPLSSEHDSGLESGSEERPPKRAVLPIERCWWHPSKMLPVGEPFSLPGYPPKYGKHGVAHFGYDPDEPSL